MQASTEAALMLTDAVLNITSQPERLDTSAIAVTTTLIENLTQTAIQQPEVHTHTHTHTHAHTHTHTHTQTYSSLRQRLVNCP